MADQEMPRKCKIGNYFATPFPRREGFSPYHFPGLIVHVPILLLFVVVGMRLTWWNPWLWPLFTVYLAAGIYLGRDLAIFAHYNPLITLIVVGGLFAAVFSPQSAAKLWPPPGSWPLSLGITAAVGALFGFWVWWRMRDS